jgi:hypothetical protein
LAAIALPVLKRKLRGRFPSLASEVLNDAAEDSIIEYSKKPHTFDQTRCVHLSVFLYKSACRNVIDIARADVRRRIREAEYARHLPRWKEFTVDDAYRLDTAFRIMRSLSEYEVRALRKWLEGHFETAALAAQLHVNHLPFDRQQRLVKQFKDRVTKKLFRAVRRGRTQRVK